MATGFDDVGCFFLFICCARCHVTAQMKQIVWEGKETNYNLLWRNLKSIWQRWGILCQKWNGRQNGIGTEIGMGGWNGMGAKKQQRRLGLAVFCPDRNTHHGNALNAELPKPTESVGLKRCFHFSVDSRECQDINPRQRQHSASVWTIHWWNPEITKTSVSSPVPFSFTSSLGNLSSSGGWERLSISGG